MNRRELGHLLGSRVLVTDAWGTKWSGKLIGLADHPTMTIEHGDGTRSHLPQSLNVTADSEPETHGMAWLHQCGHLNQGAWNDQSVCGGCRFSVEHAEYVDAHYVLTVVPAVPEETR